MLLDFQFKLEPPLPSEFRKAICVRVWSWIFSGIAQCHVSATSENIPNVHQLHLKLPAVMLSRTCFVYSHTYFPKKSQIPVNSQ